MHFSNIIRKEQQEAYFKELSLFLEKEYDENVVYPPKESIFRCFEYVDYDDVKVVIIGQDPYHEKNQANGLAFSVEKGVKLPKSLINIFKEAHDDVGIDIPAHGDLSSWAKQGVLLMNTVFTVREHLANSHRDQGWEIFSDHMISYLNKREKPLIFVLWGKSAQSKKKMIDASRHNIIESAHPSPLSAYRGFFGSKPFSKINSYLSDRGEKTIDWRII